VSPPAATVGFVGLGAMGAVQAGRLLDASHPLAVFDARPEPVARLAARGARACASVAEVAAGAETVLVSLPTPEVVREVVSGGGGLLSGGKMRTFVDLSTTGSRTARELGAELAARGVSYLDAPVSGGVAGAEAGTLAVYAAGSTEAFERCRPLLECFAGTILRVGDEPGQGQVAKLLNNLLSASAMAITAEALTVGVKAGLEPSALLEAFNAGSGRNTATAAKFPQQVLNRRFGSGFRLELMVKDVRLALEEAAAQGVPMRLGAEVGQLWELAAAESAEGADHTEVVRHFERLAGVTVEAAEGAPGDDA
jgi:3-hydroxyisobutyrate dehydrogenase-like beta-hydroxyacid dehydrogenase